MKLIKCSECKATISNRRVNCRYCGAYVGQWRKHFGHTFRRPSDIPPIIATDFVPQVRVIGNARTVHAFVPRGSYYRE